MYLNFNVSAMWHAGPMESQSIGQRVAIARRRRGLSQAVLANLIGRSESWLSQVERGVRSVDRLPVLMDLAKVLHVEVEALLGRPWNLAPNGGAVANELDPTRRYINGYRHLFDVDEVEVDTRQLREMVDAGHVAYQAAHYGEVASRLPSLLARLGSGCAPVAAATQRCNGVVRVGVRVGREIAPETRCARSCDVGV